MSSPQRLWRRIWLAVLATIVLVTVLSFALLRVLFDPQRIAASTEQLAQEVAATLPSADSPATTQQAVLEQARGDSALALFDAERRPLAQTGRPLPAPGPKSEDSHWMTRIGARGPPLFALRLDDGRWLVVGRELRPRHAPFGGLLWFAALAAIAGIGAYPVVRRLTRRLERLQAGVDKLGRGDLRARVPVEGRDEVAQLAASFNAAASRIEQLVQSNRDLLANTSHELRSPLARVRLAVELLGDDPGQRPALRRELERDIAELDALIDEILLSSRLDAQAANGSAAAFEPLDLTALAAEEGARVGASVAGAPFVLYGDPRLLRRLLRNLLENARAHGGEAPIEVQLRSTGKLAELTVSDRGPGVPAEERERIFEPFYRMRGGKSSGTGLGLALVRRIAQQHGGEVRCLPRDGGGALFRVTLPLDQSAHAAAKA